MNNKSTVILNSFFDYRFVEQNLINYIEPYSFCSSPNIIEPLVLQVYKFYDNIFYLFLVKVPLNTLVQVK